MRIVHFSIFVFLFFLNQIQVNGKITPKELKSFNEIGWIRSDMKLAYKKAKESSVPLFLYWGAKWCPPCNQLKKNIFTSSQFKNVISSFVPVYLDGDDSQAQYWADQLQVKGYPTVLIIAPNGQELYRISSALTLDQYLKVMSNVRQSMESIEQIIALWHKGPNLLTQNQWLSLANYSWDQDHRDVLSKEGRTIQFKKMVDSCPKEFIDSKTKLYLQYLRFVVEEDNPQNQFINKSEVIGYLDKVLNDSSLAINNFNFIVFDLNKTLNYFLKDKNENLAEKNLRKKLRKMMGQLQKNSKLTAYEQLLTYQPILEFYNKQAPGIWKRKVVESVHLALKNNNDPYSLQRLYSTGATLFLKAGMVDQAKDLLKTAVDASPDRAFFFMSYLAEIEEEEGHMDEALKWYQQAYLQGEGRSTKIQWGIMYLKKLLENQKTTQEQLGKWTENIMSFVFNDVDFEDGRNLKQMEKLLKSLKKLKEDGAKQSYNLVSSKIQKTCKMEKCSKWIAMNDLKELLK